MPLPWRTKAAPSVSDGGSGGAATDLQVVPAALQTPTELSTAHAQLMLLEGLIRAAVASTGTSQASAQSYLQPFETTREMNGPTASRKLPAELATSTGTMASVPAPSATAAAPSSSTERLRALHDNLRRVRHLMQQYEETSQRVVEVHLIPSPETGEPTLGSVATPTAIAGKRTKVTRQQRSGSESAAAAAATKRSPMPQNSLNSADHDSSGGSSPPALGSLEQAAEPQKASPSLHQRRALTSDAVFTRFCSLRVPPDQLLLPIQAPASPSAVAGLSTQLQQRVSPRDLAVLRGIEEGAAETEKKNDGSSSNRDTACAKTRSSSNGTRSPQTPGGASAKDKDNSGFSGSLTSFASSTAQQRTRTSTEALLEAYAKLFYHPYVTAAPAPTADAEVVRELQDVRDRLAALQHCNLFAYEARLRAEAEAATAESHSGDCKASSTAKGVGPAKRRAATGEAVDDIKWQHIPIAIQHMQDGVTALQTRFTRDSHYARCGGQPISLIRQLSVWTQPLLRQLSELLSKRTLDDMAEITREKLRRMKFDVEELQQAQAEAISNGDMQRSEELYYEQTSVAEAMAGPYDELEATMLEYGEACVDAPLRRLLEERDLLTAQLTSVIETSTGKLTEVSLDVERVKEKRRAVAQARHRQRNSMSAYHHAWKRAWQTNSDQQMACYRAIEQLERQLSDLQQTQRFLVDDWISRVTRERQREEDAAAFACFADARGAALAETQSNLQTVVEGVRQYSGTVQFSCRHIEAFVCEVLRGHLSKSQLALRKDRLEQFRTLYLTLGDLRFKKARSAEEIQKNVDHYTLQQEVAMDALNPRAKEFSKAKRQWESAKAEALKELDQLDQRSRRQLEGFRQTERLLREAGVNFVSPEEELARRTEQRSQKLLQYQQLIEEGIGVRPATSTSGAPASASPTFTALEVSTPALAVRSSACTGAAAGLLGTNSTPSPRLQAFGSLGSSPRPPTAADAALSKASDGKNGRQLPSLRSTNCTYPPPQRTDDSNGDGDGDESLAPTKAMMPSLHGSKPTSAAAAVGAGLAAASVSSLHSTEECDKQGISKTALGDRSRAGTISNTVFTRGKFSKR
ncbi:hypothetical protein LSCM1_07769 [Leishmania martiniquensis]|uniref:Paraflagellar rod protein n=1 Tax=Leishmania martiniquensis TaxID=1580590 RepID=A0A836HJ13_9TRYP|nr:hypothetical protein LSCM1_07769 [Leishmania martiniquensis]